MTLYSLSKLIVINHSYGYEHSLPEHCVESQVTFQLLPSLPKITYVLFMILHGVAQQHTQITHTMQQVRWPDYNSQLNRGRVTCQTPQIQLKNAALNGHESQAIQPLSPHAELLLRSVSKSLTYVWPWPELADVLN